MLRAILITMAVFGLAVIGFGQAKPQTKPKASSQTKATAKATPKPPVTPLFKPAAMNAIKDGSGIAGIKVGSSTSADVIKKFGNVYRWEINKKYSYQMTYDRIGVSFYFCQSDKTEEIFLIEIKSPFKGKTSKGVILGTSTKEETEKKYGKPKEGFEYPGINFYYNKYGNRNVISEIDILEPSGLRQCKDRK